MHLGKIGLGNGGYGGHTIAGDWIVWVGKERLSVLPVAEAFANARSAPPPAALTPSAKGAQVVAVGVNNAPVGAGSSLFWLGAGSNNRIYKYDLDAGKSTVFAEGPEYKLAVASDGQDTAWVELLDNGLYRIQHYSSSTKQVSTVMQTTQLGDNYGVQTIATGHQAPPPLALDQGVLYYMSSSPEHKGLWARTLATGQEQLISPVGYGPVAAEGQLMWTEQRKAQTLTGVEWTLHLRSKYSPDQDNVLARYIYAGDYADYSVSEENAVWQSGGHGVNRYTISTRTFSVIPPQYAFPKSRIYAPLISGTKAVWTELVDDQGGSWSIRAQQLDTGTVSTLVSEPPRGGKRVDAWAILDGRAVAYRTIDNSSPRGSVLQVAPLP